MLATRTIVARDGLEIADVACRHGRGRGVAEEASGYSIGFVRRGCFARTGTGGRALLDPSSVFFASLGEEQRYDHPHEGGDDCTAFLLSPDLVASIWGGDPALPAAPLHTPPELDMEHRLLLAAAADGADADALFERAMRLLASTLAIHDPERVRSGEPGKGDAQRAIVAEAREALAADPGRSLPELAALVAVSPHHLSRLFRAHTGHTVSRHRMRLRSRAALERLAGGERDLARLAADLGFADQSHLCRVLRGETGSTPSALRAALADGAQEARG